MKTYWSCMDDSRSKPHTVYEIYADDGRLLYVGCSVNVAKRLQQHAIHQPWWPEVARVEEVFVGTYTTGHAEEERRIRAQRPAYNRTANPASDWDRGGWRGRKARMASRHAAGTPCGDRICSTCPTWGSVAYAAMIRAARLKASA